MNSIERVDEMVRKNVSKYIDLKNREAYERELKQYEKKRKKDSLKSYAEIIKEGNRKAVEKMKEKNSKMKNKKNKTEQNRPVLDQRQVENQNIENKKSKLNERQIKKIQSAIEQRAQKILQQRELQKLDKCLVQEKRKTKLHELNQKCRRIARSSVKLSSTIAIQEDRKKILQQFEQKALAQVQELDNIIEDIISKRQKKPLTEKNKERFEKTKQWTVNKKQQVKGISVNWANSQEQSDKMSSQLKKHLDPFENMLFTKSTEQLLSLEYIPL